MKIQKEWLRCVLIAAMLIALLFVLSGCDRTPEQTEAMSAVTEAPTAPPTEDPRLQLSFGPIDRSVTELKVDSITEEDLVLLKQLPELTLLDGRESADAALLQEFSETVSYPVLWSVPLGDATFDSTTEALDVPASVDTADDVIQAIEGLPELKTVDLSDSALPNKEITAVLEAQPELEIQYQVTVQGVRLNGEAETLALSADAITDWDALAEEFAMLKNLRTIDVEGMLTVQQAAALLSAAKDIPVNYTVRFRDMNIASTDESVDFSALRPSDYSDIVNTLLVLPNVKLVNLMQENDKSNWKLDEADRLQDVRQDLLVNFRTEAFGVPFSLADEVVSFNGIDLRKKIEDLEKLLPYMRKVKRLDMENCCIGNETMAALRDEFPQPKIVWSVTIGGYNPIRTDSIMIKFSAAGRRTLHNKDVKNLKYCRDLKYIDLGHNKLTKMDFVQYMPDLEVFIMFNPVTSLDGIENCKKLEYFECFSCMVSDLTPLASCTELKHLNLCYNHITDITPLYGLTKLERLWISRNKIPQEQIEEFKRLVPNCVVNTTTHNPTGEGWRTDKDGNYVERYALLREQFQYEKTELRSY